MKHLTILACLLMALAAGALTLTQSAAGQLADAITADIIVGNADAVRDETIVANASLDGLLGNTAVRPAVEFANAIRYPAFAAPPDPLAARLGQVSAYTHVAFANAVRHAILMPPPPGMVAALDGVGPRIVFTSAGANRALPLAYPKALVNDTTAPVLAVPTQRGAIVRWSTNEFTSTVFRYGTSQAQLDQQIVDALFAKTHEVTLPAVQPGITYYFQIATTDLSGNLAVSPVYEYRGQVYLYLPAVRRN